MHEGDLKNLREIRDGGYISKWDYLFYRIFFELKYWRRILIRKINKIKN